MRCNRVEIRIDKKFRDGYYPSLRIYKNEFYLCSAGFSGAGAGASAGFSGAGACSGAGAGAGAGASGAGGGVSAFLQPTLRENDTSSISAKSITKNFFINCHLLS
jgi:hypothetical protein